ncbi:STAS domain-containing protein [Saccharothrix hoggarensis]|uniref:Anti-sigma factor antagonist n=1 Tax=Saccharothrix hoggarensis TaxID=913853 RepID=A0ABW3QW11_9PSEU
MDGNVDQAAVTVKVARRRGVAFVEVHGEIDTDTYRQVRQELFACLDGATSALVVDLAGVAFLGSMGIAVLVEVRERARELGVGFAVAAGQRTVVRPMRMSEVDRLLGLCATVAEAVAVARVDAERRPLPDGPAHNAPVQAPARNAPVQAPVRNAPVQAPVQTPVRNAPVSGPVRNAPVNAPAHNAPVNAPADAPVHNAPVDGPGRADDGFSWWSS